MKTNQQQRKQFDELLYYGTPLDELVLENARDACQGLEITQTGNCLENVVYAQASGGVGIVISLGLENISNQLMRVAAIQLKMPWLDADFHWLNKLSFSEERERGGYVLPPCGPCGFEPTVVLNHRFGRDFKLFPGDPVEGLLLGEGSSSVPNNYRDRMQVPMQLVVFAGKGERFEAWVNLAVTRQEQRTSKRSSRRAALFSQPQKAMLW